MGITKKQLLEKLTSNALNHKIDYWTVENFGTYESARFSFDDEFDSDTSGILMLKGKNSNGKSWVIRSLQAALTTAYVKNGKARHFIRHDSTEARINIFFTDGVEIEYLLMLSSLPTANRKPRFSNGYHMYYHHKGKRIELYNSKSGERYLQLKETPSEIARYLNLAELDGRYLNIMRRSEGLLVLEQTPRALMKSLSKVADLESAEKAIDSLTKDNRKTWSEIVASYTRIELYNDKIKSNRHLTSDVISTLVTENNILEDLENASNDTLKTKEIFERLSQLTVYPELPNVPVSELNQVSKILGIFDNLSSSVVLSELPLVDTAKATLVSKVLKNLTEISQLSKVPEHIEKTDVVKLSLLASIEKDFARLNKLCSSLSPTLSVVDTSGLDLVNKAMKELNLLNRASKTISHLDEQADNLLKENQAIVEKLKANGYPVAKCSVCGELSVMLDVDFGHKHEEVTDA